MNLNDQLAEQLLVFLPAISPTSIGLRDPKETWASFGFARYRYRDSGWGADRLPPRFCTSVFFPAWFLVILSALLPFCWLCGVVRAGLSVRRARTGICSACGYDLRASVTRCPECGAPIKSKHLNEKSIRM